MRLRLSSVGIIFLRGSVDIIQIVLFKFLGGRLPKLTYKGKTLSVYLKNWSLLIRGVSGGFGVLRGRDHSSRRLCQSGESQ